jgi:HAE1 family hydrophobic/amphiphilic exporter-1
MQWLAKLSVKRPVLATVLILLISVVGFAGLSQLGVDRFPKVDFPTVVVMTTMPGAAPQEVESEVTQKIEEAVNSISGIDMLRSTSSEGVSQVIIQFTLETDTEVAAQEVREKVATVTAQLPKGADAPTIMKMSSDAAPVMVLALKADRDVRDVSELADKSIRRQLENVNGVGQVKLVGARQRQINVILDVDALRAHGLTAVDVERAIGRDNATSPGGRIESGPKDVTLRVRGRVESPNELRDIVVRQVSGHSILVGDVARVEDGIEAAENGASIDGNRTVLLTISKQSGSNSVTVVNDLQARLVQIRQGLPAGYELVVVRDESATIRTSLHAVEEHLVIGGIMAAIVVLLFLGNVRSTIIAAVAIPVSIIGTFALMWIEGFTMNTITLLALALSVGIVIDDAIVVLENIVRFIDEKGMKPFPAAILATREIGMAVMATTLSLVAVFLPVAFMGGIVGRFLKSFGVTMSFAIGVSLLVSFTLTPMMSARWLKALRPAATGPKGEPKKPLLMRIVDNAYLPIERAYVVALRWVMGHRWVVVVASLATLGSCVPLASAVPKGFLPKSDEARFEIVLRAPEGTSLDATQLAGERLAREVRKLPGVNLTVLTVGDNAERQANTANLYVSLIDPQSRKLSQDEIMNLVRTQVVKSQPKEMRINVYEVQLMGGGSGAQAATIQYIVSGPDLAELAKKSELMAQKLRAIPGAVDVETTLVSGKPEVNVRIDRARAADLGVNVVDIASTLRLVIGGADVSTFEEKGEVYDVNVRGQAEQRISPESLAQVMVPSRTGSVRLLDVVRLEQDSGPSQIERMNRKRQVMVVANVAPGYADGTIASAFEAQVPSLGLGAGYQIEASGRTREMARTATGFLIAFGLSFLFMYLILAAQFESWVHPITILLSLPLTVPFAMISLIVFHQALDIYSALGILVLFGVVKKNSILQIEHTNQLRREGMDRLSAILQANKDRLRPILMTTLAFVAGMVPLVTSNGIGSGFNRATAGVIVGGQSLSLILTLLATPVAYSLLDDAAVWLKRRFAKKSEEDRGESEVDALDGAHAA